VYNAMAIVSDIEHQKMTMRAAKKKIPVSFKAAVAVAPLFVYCLCLWFAVGGSYQAPFGDYGQSRRLEDVTTPTTTTTTSTGDATVQCFGASCVAVKCNITIPGQAEDCKVDLGAPVEKPALWKFLLCTFGLFYMFVGLYIVCDEFFVPSLDKISAELDLSSDVAGATFMAAGGSAPEFCTSMIGALSPIPSDVGIAAIVGSAVFNVLFVIGACGLASPSSLQLTWYPLARDCTFYLIDLAVMVWAFGDAQIDWYEALILFGLYVAYCLFMAFNETIMGMVGVTPPAEDGEEGGRAREIRARFEELDVDQSGSLTKREIESDPILVAGFDSMDEDHDGTITLKEFRKFEIRARRCQSKTLGDSSASEEEEETPENHPIDLSPPESGSCKDWAWYILSLPLVAVMMGTIPDVRREGCWQKMYVGGFFMSIAWVAVFSYGMVSCSEVVGAFTGIAPGILALTLLAWGTSVPDLLTSVLVTVQGHGDMAVSSSIGSNIFDVTVGLPVPWLVFAALNNGDPVKVGNAGLVTSMLMLVAMVFFTIGSIALNKWHLNKALGGGMIVLWFVFQVYSIYSYIQSSA